MNNSIGYARVIAVGVELQLLDKYSPEDLNTFKNSLRKQLDEHLNFDDLIIIPGVKGVYYVEQKKY